MDLFARRDGAATIIAQRDSITTRDQLSIVERVANAIVSSGVYILEMFWPAMVLRTLAAGYAEAGRFSEAIKTAQEALQLFLQENDAGMAEDLRLNIANYQANLPLRDSSLSHVAPSP